MKGWNSKKKKDTILYYKISVFPQGFDSLTDILRINRNYICEEEEE